MQAQAARKLASCGSSLDAPAHTPATGCPASIATPSLDYSTRGMLVYLDGHLTARYSTHLGVATGAKEVLTSMHDKGPNDVHFAGAGHVMLGMELPAAAEHVPRRQHLWYARCMDIGQPMLPDEHQY
ncbi:MAG: hypothetical protein MJA30_35420 [Cytophagales bacterium]|nr:hypothetical protein [Cytophagales bacterium]